MYSNLHSQPAGTKRPYFLSQQVLRVGPTCFVDVMPARREGGRQGEGLIHSTGLQKTPLRSTFCKGSVLVWRGLCAGRRPAQAAVARECACRDEDPRSSLA